RGDDLQGQVRYQPGEALGDHFAREPAEANERDVGLAEGMRIAGDALVTRIGAEHPAEPTHLDMIPELHQDRARDPVRSGPLGWLLDESPVDQLVALLVRHELQVGDGKAPFSRGRAHGRAPRGDLRSGREDPLYKRLSRPS